MSDDVLRKIQDDLNDLSPKVRGCLERAKFHINGHGGVIRRKSDGKMFVFAFAKLSPALNLIVEGYPINTKTGKHSTLRSHLVGIWSDFELSTFAP